MCLCPCFTQLKCWHNCTHSSFIYIINKQFMSMMQMYLLSIYPKSCRDTVCWEVCSILTPHWGKLRCPRRGRSGWPPAGWRWGTAAAGRRWRHRQRTTDTAAPSGRERGLRHAGLHPVRSLLQIGTHTHTRIQLITRETAMMHLHRHNRGVVWCTFICNFFQGNTPWTQPVMTPPLWWNNQKHKGASVRRPLLSWIKTLFYHRKQWCAGIKLRVSFSHSEFYPVSSIHQ